MSDMVETIADADGRTKGRADLLSIVTPAFNEEENLPILHEKLCAVLDVEDVDWEWIIIDDHSEDATFTIAQKIAAKDSRVRCLRLSRNSGSHTAFTCGLHHCNGDGAVLMASDMQDPPEVISEMIKEWQDGGQIVLGVRRKRAGESFSTLLYSKLYYLIMRQIFGLTWIPATGTDFMLIDRRVISSFQRNNEHNVHVFFLIKWMGFRQRTVYYDKEARLHGASGWTLAQKFKLAVDTIIPFSYAPIRLMSLSGVFLALSGFGYALYVIFFVGLDSEVRGWSSIMVVLLIIGGTIMMMLGVLGEYIWRAYEETRKRPAYSIENSTDADGAAPPAGRT